MNTDTVWTRSHILLLVCVAVASAWIAAGITLLNLAGRVVMSMGGFVASGGPYAIAHPAPGWIGIVPIALVSTAFMAVFSVWLSHKTGGFSLLTWLWAGLFVSLGVQFAIFGLKPPAQSGVRIVWAWILCAAFFLPMGIAPLIGARWLGNPTAVSNRSSGSLPAETSPAFKTAYAVCVLSGAAAGIAGGKFLFQCIAG
ncbi:hypothetical protein JW777_00070 [bacterium]|nr:hypothetical protein [bacterium]